MKLEPNIRATLFFFFSSLAALLAGNRAAAQNAIAVSGTGIAYVALDWPAYPGASAYNIFRKAATATAYPTTPVNASPIRPAATCAQIKSLLIQGTDSANWKLVARALADSVLFNPCLVNATGLPAIKAARLAVVARSVLPVAEVIGTGYEDKTVTATSSYVYEIVALDAGGHVLGIVDPGLAVTAGVSVPLPAPTGVVAEAGDAMAQVMWNAVPGAGGYDVQRSLSPGGPFQRVDSSTYSTNYTHHLNGDTLIPASPGYLDFQVLDSTGKPITHTVSGVQVGGPADGTTYYYRVLALDFFNKKGSPSVVSGPVTPKDTTRPAVAGNLTTAVDNIHGYVKVSWTQVVKDVKGRWEQPDSSVSYQLYRFTNSGNPLNQAGVLVAAVPPARGVITRDTTDTGSGLRAPYGDKTWWYRTRSVDANGNISSWSAAVSAIVKDTTPPAIVTGLSAMGFPDHISLNWHLNTEPDMASYMVYRSLCHLGAWVNCNQPDTCYSWYGLPRPRETINSSFAPTKGAPCPCSGAFVFLGSITQDSAKRAVTAGHFMYNDYTVPPGSPLCYAYWIKAKDSSGNESGSFPIPSTAELAQIECVHLRDTTPPAPAVISGLNALPNSIGIEWIGPPSQDIRAYHVYRALGTAPGVEPPVSAFIWVGGMTVEIPPKLPQVLTSPYVPPAVLPCDSIPVQAMPWMSVGGFLDVHVLPKLTYWYRVVGIDYAGNQTPLSKAAPVSTFTFTLLLPPAPVLDTLLVQGSPCAVQVLWTNPVTPGIPQLGVIVYRSSTAAGVYVPIVTSPVKGSSFTDTQVVKGQTYYYKIALMLGTGQLSPLSPVKFIIP